MIFLALTGCTVFLASLLGVVMLIKMGGWLSILAAILILLGIIIESSLIVMMCGGIYAEQKKRKETKQ